jgi:hypothetical protein
MFEPLSVPYIMPNNPLKFVALCKHLECGSRNWCLAYAEYAFIKSV